MYSEVMKAIQPNATILFITTMALWRHAGYLYLTVLAKWYSVIGLIPM